MKTFKSILFLSTLLLFASCEDTSEPLDDTDVLAENDEAVSDCSTAPASWFTKVDGVRVTPAPNEGDTSVFANNKTVTNCDFQRWSWQKFLWLTNETNGRPFFLDNMTQVSSHGDTLGKGGKVILTDTGQASKRSDILKTNMDPASTSNTVYYSIMANDILLNTMKKYGPMVNNPADSTKLKSAVFPVGALEMKTSWLDATTLGSDSITYYITDGTINGEPKRVALLGIHVVGVVENHPEFVWATFEHDALAPQYDWSKATYNSDADVTSSTAYPFFAANATATPKNITTGAGIYTNIFDVYEYGVPVEIDSATGKKVFMPTSQANAQENIDNITGLNTSVKSQLGKEIWKHYFLNSSLWIDTEGYKTTDEQAALLVSLGSDLGNSNPGKLPRGSVAAYNITMETYVQFGYGTKHIYSTTVDSLMNCFGCHSASYTGTKSPLKISHLFDGYASRLEGMSKEEVKQQHVEVTRANAILNSIRRRK